MRDERCGSSSAIFSSSIAISINVRPGLGEHFVGELLHDAGIHDRFDSMIVRLSRVRELAPMDSGD